MTDEKTSTVATLLLTIPADQYSGHTAQPFSEFSTEVEITVEVGGSAIQPMVDVDVDADECADSVFERLESVEFDIDVADHLNNLVETFVDEMDSDANARAAFDALVEDAFARLRGGQE